MKHILTVSGTQCFPCSLKMILTAVIAPLFLVCAGIVALSIIQPTALPGESGGSLAQHVRYVVTAMSVFIALKCSDLHLHSKWQSRRSLSNEISSGSIFTDAISSGSLNPINCYHFSQALLILILIPVITNLLAGVLIYD